MPLYRVQTTLDGWSGGPGKNTFHMTDRIGAPGEVIDDAIGLLQAMYIDIRPYLISTLTVTFPNVVEIIDPDTGEILEYVTVEDVPAPVTGGATGASSNQSRATQLRVNFATNAVRAGRRLRGGVWLGPCATTAVDINGNVPVTVRNAVEGGFSGLLDPLGRFDLAVYGRPLPERPATATKPVRPALPGVNSAVTQVRCNLVPGTLRSRKT